MTPENVTSKNEESNITEEQDYKISNYAEKKAISLKLVEAQNELMALIKQATKMGLHVNFAWGRYLTVSEEVHLVKYDETDQRGSSVK